MNIYNDYLNTIKTAIASDTKSGIIGENLSFGNRNFNKAFSYKEFKNQFPEKRLLPSLADFANQIGLQPNFEQRLGAHPDFIHLKHTGETEKHYIISMFIDIKGSTNLFKRYTPETVLIVTNTIQKAAIHTCLIFGGYVHRLQGDGLFVYFGGKAINIPQAILYSLQSASVFSYFVKNDLKNLFNEQGIEDINTRIGIDLGHAEDVVWAMAGMGEISEVTTCSLHTSLASKMQGNAVANGIVVGDNIKTHLPTLKEFTSPVSHRTNNESDRYIFRIPEENFNYTQYDFSWLNFLKKQDFIVTDLQGNINLKKKTTISLGKSTDSLHSIAIHSKPYLK
jgi:adenylate cyclase